jgi:hypothetical protein
MREQISELDAEFEKGLQVTKELGSKVHNKEYQMKNLIADNRRQRRELVAKVN